MTTVHAKLFAPLIQTMLNEKAFELIIHADQKPNLMVNSVDGALVGPIEGSEVISAETLTAALNSIKAATSSTDGYSGYYLHTDNRFRYFFTDDFISFRFIAKETPNDSSSAEEAEEALSLLTSPVGSKSFSVFVDEEPYKQDGPINGELAAVDLHDKLVEIYGQKESITESHPGLLIAPLVDKMLEAKATDLFIRSNEVPRLRVSKNGEVTYPYIEGAEPTPPHEIAQAVKTIRKATSSHIGHYFLSGERFRYYLEGDAITLRHIAAQVTFNQAKIED